MIQASADVLETASSTLQRSGSWFTWIALGVAVGGLVLGLAAGTIVLLLRPSAEFHDSQFFARDISPQETKNLLVRADEKLLERDYGAALALYRTQHGPDPEPLVRWRMAISWDGLGKWTEAQQAYAELAQRHPETALAFATHWALARLEYRLGHQGAACRRLAQALLSATENVQQLPSVIQLARLEYWAWRLLQQTPENTSQFFEPGLVFAPWELEPPESIWLRLRPLGEQVLRPWPVAHEALQTAGGASAEEILINLQTAHTNLADLLQHLSQQTNLELVLTPAARIVLNERSAHNLRIENRPLGEVLTLLTNLADCVWYRDGNKLHVLTAEQCLPHQQGQEALSARVRQSLYESSLAVFNRMLLASRDEVWPGMHCVFWLKGLCHYHLGQRSQAHTWWERFLVRWPQRTEAFYISFNLAVLSWQEGEMESARRMWVRAADQVPDHPFTGRAYLFAGRAELEQLRVDAALPWLRRAARSDASRETRLAGQLLLAASYLYLDNPPAAHQVMLENRSDFRDEPYRSCAAFLDALARSRLNLGRSAARREAEDLLTALLHVSDWRLLEPLGPLLAGQAWMRLRLPEQAYRVYRLVLPRARSLWRKELLLAYGESCLQLERHGEIREIAQELLQPMDSPWSPAAHWLLARSAFQQADYRQAVDEARQVLLRPGKIPQESVLRLMGEAYSALGDLPRAAECFAGRFPEP